MTHASTQLTHTAHSLGLEMPEQECVGAESFHLKLITVAQRLKCSFIY